MAKLSYDVCGAGGGFDSIFGRRHYDSREFLSPGTTGLYEQIWSNVDCPPLCRRLYVLDDENRPLDVDISRIALEIAREGPLSGQIAGFVIVDLDKVP